MNTARLILEIVEILEGQKLELQGEVALYKLNAEKLAEKNKSINIPPDAQEQMDRMAVEHFEELTKAHNHRADLIKHHNAELWQAQKQRQQICRVLKMYFELVESTVKNMKKPGVRNAAKLRREFPIKAAEIYDFYRKTGNV